MTHVVPTIRAGALLPAAGWLERRARPVEPLLRAAGLSERAPDEPDEPIPVACVAAFLRLVAGAEGPAALWQAGSATDLLDLGGLGAQVLAAGTPERALRRIEAPMARHCTHERITVEPLGDSLRIRDVWALRFDPETLHCVQAYTAGIIGAVCAATGAAPPLFARVALTPHPACGVEHLRPWLGGSVAGTADAALVIDIPWRVARAPFLGAPTDARTPDAARPLREGQSFATSVQRAISGMMSGGALTIDRVAAASGMSVRTFQRRLVEDGATFSEAVDAARRAEALTLIATTDIPLAQIAARLGYANPSALTRAARRWTGKSPLILRAESARGRNENQAE